MRSPLLNSWKEIAQYLGRGVRTVERWEKELGLPVRRPRNRPHSPVVAIPAEIDAWLRRNRHIGEPIALQPRNDRGDPHRAATRNQLNTTSRTIHHHIHELQQVLTRMTARVKAWGLGFARRADFTEGSRMALDTKTLQELEQLANNLRQQIRLHPQHSKLEEVELREVEEWIELRRKDGGEVRTAAA